MLPPVEPCASAGAACSESATAAASPTAAKSPAGHPTRMDIPPPPGSSVARPACAVGARRADDPASFAAPAALVKRRLLRLLDIVARHDRKAGRRQRERAA